MTLLVIDNYDSFTYNLVHYAQEMGAKTHVIRNDDLTAQEALALEAEAVLLSPGPCTPNEAGICLDLIANAPENLPILGICLGQQSIGQAFVGKVISAKEIMHGKTSDIQHDGTGLFESVLSQRCLPFLTLYVFKLFVNGHNPNDIPHRESTN